MLEDNALAFIIAAHAAIAFLGGIARAVVFEGRAPTEPIQRLGPTAMVLLLTTLLACCAALGLALEASPTALIAMLAAGALNILCESRRSAAHYRGEYGRAIFAGVLWLACPTIFALAWILNPHIGSTGGLLTSWAVGAALAWITYGRLGDSVHENDSRIASAGEYVVGAGAEQLAFFVGGFSALPLTLAVVRIASMILAPINIAAFSGRTLQIAGATTAKQRPAFRKTTLLSALVVAAAASLILERTLQPKLWATVAATMPVAIVARLLVAAIYVWSVPERHVRGIWKTARERSVPSLALLIAFIVPGATPTIAFAAVALGAWISFHRLNLFE